MPNMILDRWQFQSMIDWGRQKKRSTY
nr:hypothetical protein [Streptococcus equi]